MRQAVWVGLCLTIIYCLACGVPPASRPAGAATPTPAMVRITGQVLLAGQSDSSGIQLYVPGTSFVAFTDESGHFTLQGLGPGAHRVMARAEGYETTLVGQVTLDAAVPLTDYPPLKPVTLTKRAAAATPTPAATAGSIRGRVTLAAEAAAGTATDWSGCTIELEGTSYRTICAADGGFLLWSIPVGDYRLTARMNGYAAANTPLHVAAGPEETRVEVPLTPSDAGRDRTIRGIVTLNGLDGGPSNDFDKITVQVLGHPDLTTTLGADGSFVFERLRAGKYVLTAAGESYAPLNPVEVDLTGNTEIEVQLTLNAAAPAAAPTGRLHGIALKNLDGETDMSGITVALAGTQLSATTDRDGKYAIEGIPVGSYSLQANADGFEPAKAGPLEIVAGKDLEVQGLLLEPKRDYPRVLSTDPGDGARKVPLEKEIPIMIRFSKQMDPASLRQAIHVEPGVSFEVRTGKDERDTDYDLAKVVLFGSGKDPIAHYKQRYRVTVDTTAKDVEGLAMQEPFSMQLTLGAAEIISTEPTNGEEVGYLNLQRPAIVAFNAPMDAATLGPDTVSIRPKLGSAPVMSVSQDPSTGWSRLAISSIWKPDTTYRVTIERRARTVTKDGVDNTPYTFTFKTAKLVPFELPQPPQRAGGRR